jgi:hypothetical protein
VIPAWTLLCGFMPPRALSDTAQHTQDMSPESLHLIIGNTTTHHVLEYCENDMMAMRPVQLTAPSFSKLLKNARFYSKLSCFVLIYTILMVDRFVHAFWPKQCWVPAALERSMTLYSFWWHSFAKACSLVPVLQPVI